MKSVKIEGAQIVLADDLSELQERKAQSISERFRESFILPSIVQNSQFGVEPVPFNIVPGSNNVPNFPTLDVQTGIGYTKLGERVVISSLEQYEATRINILTDDGIGGTVNTPQSTGSLNIPLIPEAINFIWIGYLPVIDPNTFVLRVTDQKRIFTRVNEGFAIFVTTNPSPPIPLPQMNPDDLPIFLGKVDLSVEPKNVVTVGAISLEGREILRIKPEIFGVIPLSALPLGHGKGLDADTVDGKHISDIQLRSEKNTPNGYAGLNEFGFIPLGLIQAGGSVVKDLNADKLDGHDSSEFATKAELQQFGAPPKPEYRFSIQGPAAAGIVVQALVGQVFTASAIRAHSDTAPEGGTLSIDVIRVQGTETPQTATVKTNVTIAQGQKSGQNLTPSISFGVGDRIAIKITSVGSNPPGGNDLMVTITGT